VESWTFACINQRQTLLGVKQMKNRSLLALVGLTISFALPTFAQQKDTPDPKIRQLIDAHQKIYDEAINTGDAAALANKMFTEDAVLVTDSGPIYGRAAIEKHYAEVFKQVHFSNFSGDVGTEYSAHIIPTTTGGTELWRNGAWSLTWQVKGGEPTPAKGYWSAIDVLEDGILKDKMQTWNVTPAPAAKPSPTARPSNQ
jgi:ketosteroid isomerase-like protein